MKREQDLQSELSRCIRPKTCIGPTKVQSRALRGEVVGSGRYRFVCTDSLSHADNCQMTMLSNRACDNCQRSYPTSHVAIKLSISNTFLSPLVPLHCRAALTRLRSKER